VTSVRARHLVAALAVVAAIGIGGCGASVDPSHLIGNAAKLTAKITQMTQAYLHHWCPHAFENNAKHLTQREARGCLQRAKNDYLGILHKSGYDPSKIVAGGG
jgi:hypothetical protein